MGKKKIALVDLSQSDTPQLKATGVRSQKIKIKKQAPSAPIKTYVEPKKAKKSLSTSLSTSKKESLIKSKKSSVKTKKRIKHPRSAKYLKTKTLIDKNKTYSLEKAVALLRQVNNAKFNASIELHCNLSVDKLSGELELPHGTGKKQKIEIATDSTLAKLNAGTIDFDVLISTPQMMPKLAKFAKVLGPKGLMPNPKTNTISDKPEEIKKKMAAGAIRFKSEPKSPLLHLVIGKMSFKDTQIKANLKTAIKTIQPKNITSAYICSSISPSIKVDF